MGVKDDFAGSSILGKFTVLVLLAANVFNWIAFCTSAWGIIYNDTTHLTINTALGLWRSCTTDSCSPLDGPVLGKDATSSIVTTNYLGAVQAFAIFGFVGINVAFLLVIMVMFTSKCKRNSDAGMAAVIICFFAAVSYLISVIVFAVCFTTENVDGDIRSIDTNTIGYSLYLAAVAFVLAVVSGALLIVDMKKGGATSPA